MNDKQLLMIILAFFAGYMFDKIMNKMCSSSLTNNRLIEGFGEDKIRSLQNKYNTIWKIDPGSSTDYMNKNNTKPGLIITQQNYKTAFGPSNNAIRYMPQDDPETIFKLMSNIRKVDDVGIIITLKVDDVVYVQDGDAVETDNLSCTYFSKDKKIFVSFSIPNNALMGKNPNDWTGVAECWQRFNDELPDLNDLSYENCCKPLDGEGNEDCWKKTLEDGVEIGLPGRSYKYCQCDPPPPTQTISFLVDASLFHDPK